MFLLLLISAWVYVKTIGCNYNAGLKVLSKSRIYKFGCTQLTMFDNSCITCNIIIRLIIVVFLTFDIERLFNFFSNIITNYFQLGIFDSLLDSASFYPSFKNIESIISLYTYICFYSFLLLILIAFTITNIYFPQSKITPSIKNTDN